VSLRRRAQPEPRDAEAIEAADERFVAELRERVTRPVAAAPPLRHGLPLEIEQPPAPEPEPEPQPQPRPLAPVAPAAPAAPAAMISVRPPQAPATATASSPRPQRLDGRTCNLVELERLVRALGALDPVRAEECRFYLLSLRHHAGADGTLPASFAPLVDSVFGPLLAAAQQQRSNAA
jgi:hypothetical protein